MLVFNFLRRLHRRQPPPGRYLPKVSVIAACKGLPRYFDENIISLLEQDYPGECEILFVSPSVSDPAFCRLQDLLKNHPPTRARLLHSDAVPVRCSEKILNLLFALRHCSAESEVFAFADCDMRLPRNWLRSMVAPLEREGTIAVSAPALYAADTLNPLQMLQTGWMSMITCFTGFFGCVFGWSWAMRRKDFDAVGIARVWETSLTDDFILNPLLRGTGKRIEWAFDAMPVCREKPDLRQVLTPFIKGFQYFRVYDKALWIIGGFEAAGKLYLCWWFLKAGSPFKAFLMPALDMATVFLLIEGLKTRLPRTAGFLHPLPRRYTFLIAAMMPALLILRVYIFLVSVCTTKVRWGGYIYQMKGPGDIRVLGTFP